MTTPLSPNQRQLATLHYQAVLQSDPDEAVEYLAALNREAINAGVDVGVALGVVIAAAVLLGLALLSDSVDLGVALGVALGAVVAVIKAARSVR